MPLQLETIFPNNGKRKRKKFVLAIDGFKDNKMFYTDADSLYIEKSFRKMWFEKT